MRTIRNRVTAETVLGFKSPSLRQKEIIRTPRQIRGSYYSFLMIISVSELDYEYYDGSRAKTIARLFLCLKEHTVAKNNDTTFLVNTTIRVLLRFFAFRLCRCSTVKSGSKREKLSPKTFIIPRVGLNFEFGSFFIYATILSLVVDFRDCDFNSHFTSAFLGATPSLPKG